MDGCVQSMTALILLEQPDGLSSLERARRVKAELAKKIPAYMIPQRIVAVDRFPLNSSGKIDRKALAAAYSGQEVRRI